MGEFIHAAERLNEAIETEQESIIPERLTEINNLNARLTAIEDRFSLTLGQGSRWLETLLMMSLLTAILIIEGTGLILTISFGHTLSLGLKELNEAAEKVGQGDFQQRVAVRTGDELGQLSSSLNKMIKALAKNIGQRLRAEEANETKSQFLANMSHEIRTPIGTIVNYAEFLKESELSEREREKFVNIIHKTGINLTRLINDILDLSKVEAGHFEVEKTGFSLHLLLAELQTMLKPKCEEKSIQLEILKNDEVADQIFSDPVRLRQILLNLLGNAIKFTDHGVVTLTYYLNKSQIVFEVSDTGIGISSESREFLFHRFSQVDDSPTRRHQGAGLGLVLSRRFAQLLGGDVTLARSVLGQGSTFIATIEYHFADDSHHQDQSRRVRVSGRKLAGHTALIVDDSEDNRFLIQRILKKQGMVAEVACNGLEAIEKVRHGNYDLIIMDIQMPVMDGYTAARNLRASGYQKPIIALTAHAMREDQHRCLDAGCTGYLTKPIQVGSLIQTLLEAIDSAEEVDFPSVG
jgi:signal transduction histidine kinase/CheY-like chemotaxis protein